MKSQKIYVAGHNGMVGSAILRKLKSKGYNNLIYRSRKELDLKDQSSVNNFLTIEKPDFIFIAAAKVGGILANNNNKAEFLLDNIQIQNNLIYGAFKNNIKNICFLGSSCIYPKNCSQPIQEEYLLNGKLEKTNEAYALAKITGIKLCEALNNQYEMNYFSLMPTNLYGLNDNYDENNSHVLPALIKKIHNAKINSKNFITIWGTGRPRREFLFVDDLADACLYFMELGITSGIYNIGTGKDISILELAKLIMDIVDYRCDIKLDKSKPDGTFQKVLDVSKANKLGWYYKTLIRDGIKKTYQNYINIIG